MDKAKHILTIIFEQIGYNSFYDLSQSVILWKHKVTTIYILAISMTGIIELLERVTEKYIYSPYLGIEILFSVTMIDILFGITKSIMIDKNFSAGKLIRAVIRFGIQITFVGIFFKMAEAWPYIFQSWMVDAMLIIFTITTFYSAIENAAKLKLITKTQFAAIKSVVNLKELLNKFKKK